MSSLAVVRSGTLDPVTGRVRGDFLSVGGVCLGPCKRIADLEHARVSAEHPENPAFNMRPMFHTGSPYGAEILALVGASA